MSVDSNTPVDPRVQVNISKNEINIALFFSFYFS